MDLREELDLAILQSSQTAIQRSRTVQGVLLVACVLALIAYWNSRDDGWTRLRMKKDSNLVAIKAHVDQMMSDDSMLGYRNYRLKELGVGPLPTWDRGSCDRAIEAAKLLTPPSLYEISAIRIPVVDATFVAYLEANDLILPRSLPALQEAIGKDTLTIDRLEAAEANLDKFRKAYIDGAMLVKLPFIGLTFDVNDLALIAGLGFTLIMLAWAFILMREGSTVAVVEDVLKGLSTGEQHPLVLRGYQLASMANVLTVSPHLVRRPAGSNVFADALERLRGIVFFFLTKSIHFMPFIIYLLIMKNDLDTESAGDAVSVGRTDMHLQLTWIFFAVLLIVTIATLLLNLWVEYQWKQMARDLKDK